MRGIAVLTAVGLLTLPALADAASQLSATKVRIGDHPAFVRVVVDFSGGVLSTRAVENLWGDDPATAVVGVQRRGVTTQTSGRTANGVRVALQPGTLRLLVSMSSVPRRFKYLSYAVVTGNRLAIDLWKSAPPKTPTQTCSGLSLKSWHVTKGSVSVRGTERGIFENQFLVIVRGAKGKWLGRRPGVHGPGKWSTKVHYKATHRQPATLEAVAFSAKDGAVECLAQRRITVPAS